MSFRLLLVPLLVLSVLRASPLVANVTVTNFDPMVGSPGDRVIINGSGFLGRSSPTVYFWNGKQASSTLTTASSITATVPNGATTGPITVVVDGSAGSSLDNFTVIGPGPYITGFLPQAGSVNDLITISGYHLVNTNLTNPTVRFNGVLSTNVIATSDGKSVNARVPAGAANGPISVTTLSGTSNSPTSFTIIGPGPYITGFLPMIGGSGVNITISGTHFTGATNAYFNGLKGANFAVTTDNSISVDTPTGVSTGPVSVRSPLGINTSTANFYVAPVITGFSPVNGRAGTNLVVRGTNFIGTLDVEFSGTNGPFTVQASFSVLSNGALNVTVPTNAATGPIRVDAPAGSFITTSNFVIQPTIFGFSPIAGRAGTNVTITGANFNANGLVVRFNGVQAQTNNVKFGQLNAVVPAAATTGPISVTTVDGSHTNANTFFLPPSISSFSPTNSAPGTTVTILGQNLLGTTNVSFGGVGGGFTPPTNNTLLLATVPEGVITGPITVAAPGGTASSATSFYGAPQVYSFSPFHGLPGLTVTVTGTNFLAASGVSFNGTNASYLVLSNGALQATVPQGATTGPISVTGPAGTGASTTNFVIDFASDLVLTVSDAPDPVFVTSNLVYQIVVTNIGPFDAPNVVVSDPLPVSLSFKSATTTKGTVTTNGTQVVGTVGTLGTSNTVTITLTVVPQTVGPVNNTISAVSGYPDPFPTNNTNTLTTTVLPLPFLGITPYSPNQSMIYWSAALTNFTLQFKSSLATNIYWSNFGSAPIISGTNKFVIDANTGPSRFYRLRD